MSLHVRVQKQTRLAQTVTLDLMLDVFNVFNTGTVIRVETLNTAITNFLRPAEILLPRAMRFGVRVNS